MSRAPALAAALLLVCFTARPGASQSGIVHQPSNVRFVFTGDINLGTRTLPDGIPPDSGRALLREVDSLLTADLVVGNFEGVLSDSGDSEKCAPKATMCYAFATPTFLAARLAEAGFTHANLANNHANDFGPAWRRHTEDTFRQLGLTPYGPRGQVAITPLIRDGAMTLVGLVGFATYPYAYSLLDLEESRAIVEAVRPLVDVLVVTFHGGREGKTAVRTGKGPEFLGREPRGDLRRWARIVLDAGADAVVGHGPHVLRGIEFHDGKPIFYSLGNFLTYRGFNLAGPLGLTTAIHLELASDGSFISAAIPSLIQRAGQGPVPDPGHGARHLLRRVTRLDFPETGAIIGEDGSVIPRP
ncbi:MAG: CapA family protein [Gemmatimonadota bacterium]|nr:CapA family protein [Gemmatimonadota bacterium]MDH5282490.1 CapA family protein [Gemmatimonadota bacterium]